jgi:hypothetical protein
MCGPFCSVLPALMIAVVLPAPIAAFTSGQVRSSMYTDCAPPECSGAGGVAANAATVKETAIAADSKTRFMTVHLLLLPASPYQARHLREFYPGTAVAFQ